MKPHPRIRKTVKWGGAVVSVLLLVVWVGSGWWSAGYFSSGRVFLVARGRIGYEVLHDRTMWQPGLWSARPQQPAPRWKWGLADADMGGGSMQPVPIWPLFFCGLLITAAAWRLDTLARRRARIGFCPKCNYDRTGLAPGVVCPECGAAAVVAKG